MTVPLFFNPTLLLSSAAARFSWIRLIDVAVWSREFLFAWVIKPIKKMEGLEWLIRSVCCRWVSWTGTDDDNHDKFMTRHSCPWSSFFYRIEAKVAAWSDLSLPVVPAQEKSLIQSFQAACAGSESVSPFPFSPYRKKGNWALFDHDDYQRQESDYDHKSPQSFAGYRLWFPESNKALIKYK